MSVKNPYKEPETWNDVEEYFLYVAEEIYGDKILDDRESMEVALKVFSGYGKAGWSEAALKRVTHWNNVVK